MRPFGPLAAFCLLVVLHLFQLVHIVHACKEIKLKFDLQRMVESESNSFFFVSVGFHPILVFRDGKEDLRRDPTHHQGHGDKHHPRAGRAGEKKGDIRAKKI